MRLDVIVRKKGRTSILDAKYYRATTSGMAPNLADIMKQIVYQKAFETCMADQDEIIESAFVFPANETHAGQFDRVCITGWRDFRRVSANLLPLCFNFRNRDGLFCAHEIERPGMGHFA
jgi:hypothetical protein